MRRLAFGPESEYVRFLGYHYALAHLDLDVGPDAVMYNEPGRLAAVGGPKAPAFFVFASERPDYDRDDVDRRKRILIDAYRNAGWRIPELMDRVPGAREFHLDSISRVEIDHYASGRVALIGDAAYGNTLAGFGSGLAIVGAYVLAGELAAAAATTGWRSGSTRRRSTAMPRWPGRAVPAVSSPRRRGEGSGCGTGCSRTGSCSRR
ncbi:hypothetical protein ACFQX6_16170 [Streptosporangium lutulentum]